MAQKQDLTGQRFGRLLVVEEASRAAHGRPTWLCKCDCGNERLVLGGNLRSGRSTSCGCSHRIDMVGQRFGLLIVVEENGRATSGGMAWLCVCTCGANVTRGGTELRLGRATSCGCANPSRTHGQSNTELYARWQSMLRRTTNPNHKYYAHYGGRGITACERWRDSFEAFAADMGPTFDPALQLDRIDTDGPYSPENCRWATRVEQARNKRNNNVVTYQGLTLTTAEWAERLGLPASTVRRRLSDGWSVERSLTTGVAPDLLASLTA